MPNGNPIARNPLLGKCGEHRRSRSGERQRNRVAVESALEDWEAEALAELELVFSLSAPNDRGQI